jgi:hypothetical protein
MGKKAVFCVFLGLGLGANFTQEETAPNSGWATLEKAAREDS